MTDVPLFGSLDAVPFRVGKLWFTEYEDFGSPDRGMGFWYHPLSVDPETSYDTDPERAELQDFAREHTSDPAPGFRHIVATSFLHTNEGHPAPTKTHSREMISYLASAVEDFAALAERTGLTDLEMLTVDSLMLFPRRDEVNWLWTAFRFRDKDLTSWPDDFAISHLAVRADAGHYCMVQFTYPDKLDAGVGFGAFRRFVYEWQTSIRRVAEGGHAIPPYTLPEEEDWGEIALAFENAPVPKELLVPRQGYRPLRAPSCSLPRRRPRDRRRLPISHRHK